MSYRPLSLVQTTPPAVDVVTVQDAFDQCRIVSAGDEDLRRIAGLIRSATDYVQDITGRQLVNATWTEKLDAFPDESYILLRKPPLGLITSVSYLDAAGTAQTLSGTTVYTYDTTTTPGRILLRYAQIWPTTQAIDNAVTIVYVAGYGAAAASVPQAFKDAILLHVADAYENRGDDDASHKIVQERIYSLIANYRDWRHCV